MLYLTDGICIIACLAFDVSAARDVLMRVCDQEKPKRQALL